MPDPAAPQREAPLDERVFMIRSLDDACSFENCLGRCYEAIKQAKLDGGFPRSYMRSVYAACEQHDEGGRLLSAVIDLELTYLFMMKDVMSSGGVWNTAFADRGNGGVSVLEDSDSFLGKVEILYGLTSFALRCRAFWDKWMGVLVLLYSTEAYDAYCKARSRRRFFMKSAQHWRGVSPHVVGGVTQILRNWLVRAGAEEAITESLKASYVEYPSPCLEVLKAIIDRVDRVRTAEAHGAGTLKKWSLSALPLDKSRDFSVLEDWNHANVLMRSLRDALVEDRAGGSDASRPKGSPDSGGA